MTAKTANTSKNWDHTLINKLQNNQVITFGTSNCDCVLGDLSYRDFFYLDISSDAAAEWQPGGRLGGRATGPTR